MDTEKDEGQTWDLSQHISVHDVDASCKFKLSKGFKMTPCPLTFERHLHSNVRQWTPTFFHFSKKHQSNIQVLRIAQMLHLSGNVPVSLSLLHTHTHTLHIRNHWTSMNKKSQSSSVIHWSDRIWFWQQISWKNVLFNQNVQTPTGSSLTEVLCLSCFLWDGSSAGLNKCVTQTGVIDQTARPTRNLYIICDVMILTH